MPGDKMHVKICNTFIITDPNVPGTCHYLMKHTALFSLARGQRTSFCVLKTTDEQPIILTLGWLVGV